MKQTKAINDTVEACFSDSTEGFKDCARIVLTRLVDDRNAGFNVQPERLSLVNRVMWKTYNLILAGPK